MCRSRTSGHLGTRHRRSWRRRSGSDRTAASANRPGHRSLSGSRRPSSRRRSRRTRCRTRHSSRRRSAGRRTRYLHHVNDEANAGLDARSARLGRGADDADAALVDARIAHAHRARVTGRRAACVRVARAGRAALSARASPKLVAWAGGREAPRRRCRTRRRLRCSWWWSLEVSCCTTRGAPRLRRSRPLDSESLR